MSTPKAFLKKLSVKRPFLLRGGFPLVFQNMVDYDFLFKTLHGREEKHIVPITAKKQKALYAKLTSTLIEKPMLIGIGSYPTDKGAMILAADIICKIKKNNKLFEMLTISALLTTQDKLDSFKEEPPEIICITGLCDDANIFMYSIENARALISFFQNSLIIIPAVTENIVDFFKYKLHKTGLYMQFSNLKKVEDV